MIQTILFDEEGKQYYVNDISRDFHTKHGFLTAKDLQSKKVIITSNTGHEFKKLNPTRRDVLDKIKRGPQIITNKDIGLIITETGLNKDSVVLDAGTGSGALACFLAGIVKKVVSYETNEKNIKIAEHNKKTLEIKNLTIKNKDVYDGITEKDLDVIILDVPEPHHVLKHLKSLKNGGFLAVYLPSLTQVDVFLKEAAKHDVIVLKTTETLQREWIIKRNIMRPDFSMLGHTAFLTLCRKV